MSEADKVRAWGKEVVGQYWAARLDTVNLKHYHMGQLTDEQYSNERRLMDQHCEQLRARLKAVLAEEPGRAE